MKRLLFSLVVTLVASAPGLAQDMPLSQILIDGEGWKKVEGKSEKPKGVKIQGGRVVDEKVEPYDITLPSNKTFRVESLPGVYIWRNDAIITFKRDAPLTALLTPDGRTLYVSGEVQPYLWAYHVDKDGKATARAPYARLRPERDWPSAVTSLATDKDGRIYAATEIGVQVFDPTGRMCGVLTPAAPGSPQNMAFEGDTLTMWIGETKYARKLRTEGVK